MIGVFLNAILTCFKHPMQLSYGLLHTIHMKVYNERIIARWGRLENHVNNQVILEFTTKFVQSLIILTYTQTRFLRYYISQHLLGSQTFYVAPECKHRYAHTVSADQESL
jgi:hypothetical protein